MSETFGNVVVEAMASGLPVVTFDYAAAREYIQAEKNGCKVPFNNNDAFIQAAVQLAQQAELRQFLGTNAAQTASQLSWDNVVEHLHQTIQTVLRDHHDRRA